MLSLRDTACFRVHPLKEAYGQKKLWGGGVVVVAKKEECQRKMKDKKGPQLGEKL